MEFGERGEGATGRHDCCLVLGWDKGREGFGWDLMEAGEDGFAGSAYPL